MDAAPPPVTAADVAAFLAELVLLGAFALAGARLADGPAGLLLAVTLPVLLGVGWGRWLAPRASRRLRHPARLAVKLVLVVGAAGLLALAGASAAWLLVLAVVAACFAVAELQGQGHRGHPAAG